MILCQFPISKVKEFIHFLPVTAGELSSEIRFSYSRTNSNNYDHVDISKLFYKFTFYEAKVNIIFFPVNGGVSDLEVGMTFFLLIS